MKNLSFEEGWRDLPPAPGNLINQEPADWQLSILPIGATLWDSDDVVTGIPECVHKLASQLPPHEQPGQPGALILDGKTVYKVFHAAAVFGVELRQKVCGLVPGSTAVARVNVRVHDHKGKDPYGVEFRMMSNGFGGWWNHEKLDNFKWRTRSQTRQIGDDGCFELVLQFKSKHPLPVDWFMDAFEFEGDFGGTEPPPDPDPPPGDHHHEDLEAAVTDLTDGLNALTIEFVSLTRRVEILEGNEPPLDIMLPTRALGLDANAYRNINWPAAKQAGVKFAILRTSNGLKSPTTTPDGRDLKLKEHAEWCADLDIPIMGFHFLEPGHPIDEQIDLVQDIMRQLSDNGTPLSRMQLSDGRLLPPIWCDVEGSPRYNDRPPTAAQVRQFVEGMIFCGIYSRKNLWESVNYGQEPWEKRIPAWMAEYGRNSGQQPPSWAVPSDVNHFEDIWLWQFSSRGGALMGQAAEELDVNLAGPFESAPLVRYDLAPYFLPEQGDFGPIGILEHNFTGSQTRMQLQRQGDRSFLTKGDEYEERLIGPDYIDLVKDTSPGDNQFYTVVDGHWILRRTPFDWLTVQTGVVTFRDKDSCETQSVSGATGATRLVDHHNIYVNAIGVQCPDTIEIEWLVDGLVDERFFYQRHRGLVEWQKADGRKSWLVRWIPLGHEGNNIPRIISC